MSKINVKDIVVVSLIATSILMIILNISKNATVNYPPTVDAQSEELVPVSAEEELIEPVPEPEPPAEPSVTWRDNPNGCKPDRIRADNLECLPDVPEQAAAPVSFGSGSCEAEILKYNWDHRIARAVMMAESGNVAGQVNDNPRTKDYSVGCFQINLYGNLKNSRPSEAYLKNAANNVAYAYNLYTSLGNTFGTSAGWGAYNNGSYLRHL